MQYKQKNWMKLLVFRLQNIKIQLNFTKNSHYFYSYTKSNKTCHLTKMKNNLLLRDTQNMSIPLVSAALRAFDVCCNA